MNGAARTNSHVVHLMTSALASFDRGRRSRHAPRLHAGSRQNGVEPPGPAAERRPCFTGLTGASQPQRAILRLMRPVDALYENGLLRPVSPLPLRSGERVAVIVVRRPDPSRWDFVRLAAHADDDLALAEAGLDEWAAALDREDRG